MSIVIDILREMDIDAAFTSEVDRTGTSVNIIAPSGRILVIRDDFGSGAASGEPDDWGFTSRTYADHAAKNADDWDGYDAGIIYDEAREVIADFVEAR